METLAQFQRRNCKGCFYADDEKVGTGQRCCTCPGIPRLEGYRCLTRRGKGDPSNATGERKEQQE